MLFGDFSFEICGESKTKRKQKDLEIKNKRTSFLLFILCGIFKVFAWQNVFIFIWALVGFTAVICLRKRLISI